MVECFLCSEGLSEEELMKQGQTGLDGEMQDKICICDSCILHLETQVYGKIT